jgi:hypothetical protein
MESIPAEESTRPRRKSAFRETGLFEDDTEYQPPSPPCRPLSRPSLKVRFRSSNDVFELDSDDQEWEDAVESDEELSWQSTTITTPLIVPSKSVTATPILSLFRRLSFVAFMLAVTLPLVHFTPFGTPSHPILGATGVPVKEAEEPIFDDALTKRDNNPTDYCKRWSQQSEWLWE